MHALLLANLELKIKYIECLELTTVFDTAILILLANLLLLAKYLYSGVASKSSPLRENTAAVSNLKTFRNYTD